ncbi:TPA: hypothetical protein DCQ44_00290 [Candidatus Taylorbacteria bacterium]|nr:hypothetical protein [Candidatus Taylorbacteria bacterium]
MPESDGSGKPIHAAFSVNLNLERAYMLRNSAGWIAEYQKKDAYWLHDGNSKRPHALLISGKHSNGFFNSRPVIADEPLLREAASDLVDLFIIKGGDIEHVDRVVGPQTGATKLAEFLSDEIGKRRKRPCHWASPAKQGEGELKAMVFNDPKHMVMPGERVLLCEDVLTTGGSVELTARAVKEKGGIILHIVLILVNRSGLVTAYDNLIVALIDRNMPTWEQAECPLCAAGSEAIRPKGIPEWARLNATY